MSAKFRLDVELVRRGLAKSRESAIHAIEAGEVLVNGSVNSKPSSQVNEGVSITIKSGSEERYASRGAYKLLGALLEFESLGLSVEIGRAHV